MYTTFVLIRTAAYTSCSTPSTAPTHIGTSVCHPSQANCVPPQLTPLTRLPKLRKTSIPPTQSPARSVRIDTPRYAGPYPRKSTANGTTSIPSAQNTKLE